MKIKRIMIFAVEILLLVLTIVQLYMIIDLRMEYRSNKNQYAKEKEDIHPIFITESNNIENEEDFAEIDIQAQESELKTLGEFKLTAYCSCYECCEQYALNRPIDENGNEIVYGAIGEVLTEGYSIAVDPDVIPYGTEVIIDGVTYKAQDCGGAIDGNEIDVYFADHKKAQEFAVQYKDVYLKG